MSEYIPSDEAVRVAAKILDDDLRFHGLLREFPTYEEMLVDDPIGASEWGGLIERMLVAAHEADNA